MGIMKLRGVIGKAKEKKCELGGNITHYWMHSLVWLATSHPLPQSFNPIHVKMKGLIKENLKILFLKDFLHPKNCLGRIHEVNLSAEKFTIFTEIVIEIDQR